jgi:arylsulfatase A-like enzyme
MKPNILLITADQWRGDCLSSMGHPILETPHLDMLASESVQFRKHYANAVPCGPSRASLHTGLYLHNHRSGTNGTPLDERFTNWALELRGLGYDPVLFGYTHTAMDPRGTPSDHPALRNDEGILPGIRAIVDMGTLCPDWREFLIGHGYQLPDNHAATYGVRNPAAGSEVAPAPLAFAPEHTDTRFLTDRVVQYVEEFEQSDVGWCVHLSLRAPHPPWVAPMPYNTRYPLDDLPTPNRQSSAEAEQSVHPWLNQHLAQARNRSHEHPRRHQKLQAGYYGLMNEVDDNIGLIVSALKESDQWNNTIVIFTSDHGEQMGDHWMYGKAGFYEQSYHIPLLIRSPDCRTGSCEEFTEHVDIFPTLMEMVGCPAPRQCDGHSLAGQLRNGTLPNWRTAAHYEYDFRHSEAENVLGLDMEHACLNVIRDDQYKYVHFAGLPALLFDVQQDPGELENIAPDQPALVARYAQRLLSWRMQTTDKSLSHLQISRERGLRDMRTER